ncbi:MAG: hypothetical protein HY912_00810 [Desulfomonile tiedjei]|uniref:Uncharacterized protein n=1 Tax=Desulfomonile tiedjei TaxID=2358 RepID=A0A9D6Z1V6_9BACT|nr:hypothetical protein [Desulfomonile tiedjei]
MKFGTWSKICLLVIIIIGSASSAQSQDIFSEMDRVKKDLSNLRDEVNQLRNLVYELRASALKAAAPQELPQAEKPKPVQEKAIQPETPVSDEELTKTICQSVGKFFSEVDVSLRANDSSAARERMRSAFRELNSILQKYADAHRVSKLLSIYQGLAWDTYVAVELSRSVQGNEEFIKAIERHKKKYAETCPKY